MIVARYEVPGIPSHRGPSHRARYELYHNARSTRKTLLADPIIPFPTGRVLRFTGFQALSFSPSGTKPPLTSPKSPPLSQRFESGYHIKQLFID
jgi:hypothetical protein